MTKCHKSRRIWGMSRAQYMYIVLQALRGSWDNVLSGMSAIIIFKRNITNSRLAHFIYFDCHFSQSGKSFCLLLLYELLHPTLYLQIPPCWGFWTFEEMFCRKWLSEWRPKRFFFFYLIIFSNCMVFFKIIW